MWMRKEDVHDGMMVTFGPNTLGGIDGEPSGDEVTVWPADTHNPDVPPGRRKMKLADLTPADMDRWMYLADGNYWVAKKPGVLVPVNPSDIT